MYGDFFQLEAVKNAFLKGLINHIVSDDVCVQQDVLSSHPIYFVTSCLPSGQYVQAFQTHPNNPLYSLCVGLTFFHMASQKYVAKRHALVLQVHCSHIVFSS